MARADGGGAGGRHAASHRDPAQEGLTLAGVGNACTLHLVRHAEHGQQGRVLVGRAPGVALSPLGRSQAAALAARYAAIPLRAVLSSPVARAAETAAAIAAPHGLAPRLEAGLHEVDFGPWTGRSFADLDGDPHWAAWNAARGLAPAPGAEAMLAVQARAVAVLAGLRGEGGHVAIVSHADVIRAVLCHVLGMPLDLMHRLEVAPGHRSAVVLGADWARVEFLNHPP